MFVGNSSSTMSVLQVKHDGDYGMPTSFSVRLNYIAFNSLLIPETVYITFKVSNDDATAKQYCDNTRPFVAGTLIGVFFRRIIGGGTSNSISKIQIDANILNDSCYSVTFLTIFGGLSNNYKEFFVLIIRPNAYFNIQTNVLSIPSSMVNSSALSVDTSVPDKFLFIGLSGIVYYYCFIITLSLDNKQIQLNYPFFMSQVDACQYPYFYIDGQKTLSLHQSDTGEVMLTEEKSGLFSNAVEFLFANIPDLQNVTADSFTISSSFLTNKAVSIAGQNLTLSAAYTGTEFNDVNIQYKSSDKIISATSTVKIPLTLKKITTTVFTNQVSLELLTIYDPSLMTLA